MYNTQYGMDNLLFNIDKVCFNYTYLYTLWVQNSQNFDFFCCVHMIFWIFDTILKEKILITLMAIAIKRTNQLVKSIAVFHTWSCEYPQRGHP